MGLSGMDVIFKLEPSYKLEINVIFKLATLGELDDASNLNQSIWVWLISQSFPGIVIVDVGPITLTVI